MKTYWHESNPWHDDVVYVTLEELAECVDKGNGYVGTPEGRKVYDNAFLLEEWRRTSDKLDAYILPQPDGYRHSIGVRYGAKGEQYFSPYANQERTEALLTLAWKKPI